MKPFSQACENNKIPILTVLKEAFSDRQHILEIGSGTGQHAVFFAQHLSELTWQTSDQPDYHPGMLQWMHEYPADNLKTPVAFTVGQDEWPRLSPPIDGVFSANTAHIMQKQEAKLMMEQVAGHLPEQGVFCQYGPFLFSGDFTSESNRQFHQGLLERGCGGLRDVDELTAWASPKGLRLEQTHALPANNHLLVWRKHG
ncbi:hypothetical protein HMF8227_02063 [Saliniradius amylolyticus]|uniref:DUF938 domain-containing protein n=1 Tax=Saliniradius amylolyticus TaxID=2183582 RepID=A0A2S2E4F4_9ALTE|nr:DUF938 domain-containing protein [Saliniradius amylolyticus]AWL12524.1 hypothetical protein HMF8227_02063 [Saliniradius amylolyticus]